MPLCTLTPKRVISPLLPNKRKVSESVMELQWQSASELEPKKLDTTPTHMEMTFDREVTEKKGDFT